MQLALLAALFGLLAAAPLRADEAAIDRVFAEWRSSHKIENAILIVEQKGRSLYRKGVGTRAPDDRVLISSLSKAITAACLGTLIRDDRLRLETTLAAALPAVLSDAGIAPEGPLRTVTLAELITHRAGLGRVTDRAFTAAQARELQLRTPSELDPRRAAIETLRSGLVLESRGRYDYSTFGYVLLGLVIERASSEPYAAYCAKSVLAPAGISDAALHAAWGFRYAAGGWALSGAEYIAFFDRMPPSADWLGQPLARWAVDGRGKEIRTAVFFSLGFIARPLGDAIEISHSGALTWNQQSRRNGNLQNSTQTYALRDPSGASVFVYAEFCQPDTVRCSTEAGWSAFTRSILTAAR